MCIKFYQNTRVFEPSSVSCVTRTRRTKEFQRALRWIVQSEPCNSLAGAWTSRVTEQNRKNFFPADLLRYRLYGRTGSGTLPRTLRERNASVYRHAMHRSVPFVTPRITPRARRHGSCSRRSLSSPVFIYTYNLKPRSSFHAYFRTCNGFRCRPPDATRRGLAWLYCRDPVGSAAKSLERINTVDFLQLVPISCNRNANHAIPAIIWSD